MEQPTITDKVNENLEEITNYWENLYRTKYTENKYVKNFSKIIHGKKV